MEKDNQKYFDQKSILRGSSFADLYLSYHRIDSYLKSNTEIYYIHDNFSISYRKNELQIKNFNIEYIRPKVLYVPAERSFCTAITNPYKVSGLLASVLDFLSDYYDASKALHGNKVLLPLNGFEFRFSEVDNRGYISDKVKNYEISVEEASSGLQSLTPMYVTIKHYLDQLNHSVEERKNEFNLFQIVELKQLFENRDLSKEDLLKEQKKIINSNLICVIEEPEQNLFPTSQYEIMMDILKGFSNNTNNSLILTTHSPYILETINNSIYADTITKQNKNVEKLIPLDQQISYENVSAYSIENGEIHSIKEDDIKQINPSAIDSCSQKISDIYSKLSDIEYGD